MSEIFAFLTEPFAFAFMRRALLIATLVGAVCALLSCYLVLKGWSLMGDAVSHAVLPGIVGAYVVGLPIAIGAFAAGFLCAVATGYIKDHCRVKEDAVMAIVFTGMFAAGMVAFVKIDSDQHLTHILFGNLLGVTSRDVLETAIVAIPTIFFILIKWRDLLLYIFDVNQARATGLPVTLLHYALLAVLALTIVASLKAVGIILVIAMLIAPGATAFLITKNFATMLFVSVATAVSSSLAGTIISFHADVATGPCIVVFQSGLLAIAIAFKNLQHYVQTHSLLKTERRPL